jgi:hypothetical protein
VYIEHANLDEKCGSASCSNQHPQAPNDDSDVHRFPDSDPFSSNPSTFNAEIDEPQQAQAQRKRKYENVVSLAIQVNV